MFRMLLAHGPWSIKDRLIMKDDFDLVVYTCTVNNYDNFSLIQRPVEGIRFVYFTNNLSKVPEGWEGRELLSPPRLTNGHDINRFHKVFPHHVLPGFKQSIYIDGNVNFNGSFIGLAGKLSDSNVAVAAFQHPLWHTLEEEAIACEQGKKFDLHDICAVKKQLNNYQAEGLDLSQNIPANYLLVRDHGYPGLFQCMSLWWSQLFEYSKRDQMSLCYSLWKMNIPWAFLDTDLGVDPDLLERHRHTRKISYRKVIRRVKKKVARFNNMFLHH